MKNILTLNSISPVINDIFDSSYNVASDATAPIGIMLRSFKMAEYTTPSASNTFRVSCHKASWADRR